MRLGDDALRSDWAHTFRSTAKMTVAEVRGRLLDCVLKPRTKADWDCRAENWRWEQERRAEGLDNKQIFDLRQAKAKAKKIEELREFAMREDKDELHIVAVIRKKYHVFSDEEILDMMPDQRRNIAAELMRKDKEGEISIEDIYQERAKAYSLEKRRGNV